MQGRHLTGPHGRRSTNGRQACGSSGVGVRFLPIDDVRDVNVSLGMADCGQHGIEQLRSAADEWLAGDVLIAAGTQARWPIREPNGGEFESFWPYLIPGGIKFPEGPTIPVAVQEQTRPAYPSVAWESRSTLQRNGPPGSGPSLDNRTV